MTLNLTALEERILGALVEKQLTTPDYYPLTLNSLLAACNQRNNRDPVMALTEDELGKGIVALQHDKHLLSAFSGAGSRALKYTHRLTETFSLTEPELAVLAELLLRGPQTLGELRTRASRMSPLETLEDVKAIVTALSQRMPEPLVREIPRVTGMKENRYMHTLGAPRDEEEIAAQIRLAAPPPVPAAVENALRDEQRLRAMEEKIATLETQLNTLSETFAAFTKQFE